MIKRSAAALLLLATGASQAAPDPSPRPPEQYAQLVVRQQIIVRTRQMSPAVAAVQWKEGKGPKCVPIAAIAGASMVSQNSVDLVLRDRRRVRAKLENCPALDYYYGFYVTPNQDGMICADRDTIRSRMGGQCEIDRFRSLEAVARN